jgi:phosphoglycerate dehydrogenase-like enzyme
MAKALPLTQSGGGNIGLLVAKMFHGAFEGTILLYDPYLRSLDAWHSVLPSTHLRLVTDIDELLGDSDIVTVHVPLTPATENMIGAKQFKTMKSSAILINTARGGIVDEQALAEALETEAIFAAGLDAFVNEPPTLSQYPELCRSDRVLLL